MKVAVMCNLMFIGFGKVHIGFLHMFTDRFSECL